MAEAVLRPGPWRSVRVRITLAAAVVTALAMAVAGWLVLRAVEDTQIGRLREQVEDRLDTVAARLQAGANPQVAADAAIDLAVPVVILDEDGTPVGAGPVTLVGGRAQAEDLLTRERILGQGGSQAGTEAGMSTDVEVQPPAEVTTKLVGGPGPGIQLVRSGTELEEVSRSVDTPDGRLTVVAGVPVDEVQRSVDAVRRSLLWGLPALVAAVAAFAWLSVGRALRPVEAIRTEVEAITAAQMHRRVPEPGSDDEIGRLARTMNAMLGRLQGSAMRQRQFVSDASHELRSPVAAIRTDVEVALREGDAADWPAVGRAVLVEEDRLERLLGDLLVLAADDEGSTAAACEVDVVTLVHAEAERARRVPVAVEVEGTPGAVAGSTDALARVVANLVDNAARHARSEVRVTVAAAGAGSGHTVRVTVDDDGPGIPEADRERVFERFTRLDDARARDDGGAGLGLAVVRSIVTRHGGHVHAEAAPLGGARLVVELPVATSA
jgi:signal transduction histidine kinase